jgi:sortase A
MAGSVLGMASGFADFSFEELKKEETLRQAVAVVPTPPVREDPSEGVLTPPSVAVPEKKEPDKFFYLDVPDLGIENAVVEINSPSLSPDSSLGHYAGSAMPGKIGNSFIYGHSVLPWFYNPRNYKTIFSTLDKLTPGKKFYVRHEGTLYTYTVAYSEVLSPNQVNPLGEFTPKHLGKSTITLMTCWPAGMKSRRFLVRGVLDTK